LIYIFQVSDDGLSTHVLTHSFNVLTWYTMGMLETTTRNYRYDPFLCDRHHADYPSRYKLAGDTKTLYHRQLWSDVNSTGISY